MRKRARRLELTVGQSAPRFRSPTTFSTSKATRRRLANVRARTLSRTKAPWSERLVSQGRVASSTAWWTRRSPRSMRLEWAPRATCCAQPHASSLRGRTEGEGALDCTLHFALHGPRPEERRRHALVLRSAEGASRRTLPGQLPLAHAGTSFEAASRRLRTRLGGA